MKEQLGVMNHVKSPDGLSIFEARGAYGKGFRSKVGIKFDIAQIRLALSRRKGFLPPDGLSIGIVGGAFIGRYKSALRIGYKNQRVQIIVFFTPKKRVEIK